MSKLSKFKACYGHLKQARAHTIGLHRSNFLQKSRYKKTGYENETYLWKKGGKLWGETQHLDSGKRKDYLKGKKAKWNKNKNETEATVLVPRVPSTILWQCGKREASTYIESWCVLNYTLSKSLISKLGRREWGIYSIPRGFHYLEWLCCIPICFCFVLKTY